MTELDVTLWRRVGPNPNEIREYQIEHCVGGEYLGTVIAGRGSLGCWTGNVFRFVDNFDGIIDAIQFANFHKKDNDAPPSESDIPVEPERDPNEGMSERQIAKEARKKEWQKKTTEKVEEPVATVETHEPFRANRDDLLGMITPHEMAKGSTMPEIIKVRRWRLEDLRDSGWVYVPDYIRMKAAERDKMLTSYKEMLSYLRRNS